MILRWLKLQRPVAHAEKALEYVEHTLALVQKRAFAHPEVGAYPWLIPQLDYVKRVLPIAPSFMKSILEQADKQERHYKERTQNYSKP